MARKMKRLSVKVMILIMVFTLAMPASAFASVKSTANDTTTAGKSLAGLHPAQPVDLQIEQSADDTDTVTFEMKGVTAEELATAVKNKTVKFDLTRNATRVYFDEKLFPYQNKGGALENWLCNDNKHKQFEVTSMKAEGTKLTITLKSNCYYWNNYGEDRTEKQGPDYSAAHDEGGVYFDDCGYFDFTASVNGKKSDVVDTKIVPYDSYKNVYELYDEIDEFATMETKNGSYCAKKSMGHTTVDGYDMPYLVVSDSQNSIDSWLAYTDQVETDPDKTLKEIAAGKYNDLRVPVIITNCHTNENTGVNGPMNFVKMLLTKDTVNVDEIQGLTDEGKKVLAAEMKARNTAVPEQIKDFVSYIGYIRGEDAEDEDGNKYKISAHIKNFDKIYTEKTQTIKVSDLLKDVMFIVVPTMNEEGYEHSTREASTGIDPNRDEANQATNEDANLQSIVNTWDAMVLNELHGRVEGTLIEPCTPPHLPDFEYDLIAKQFIQLGEALGNGAIANTENYQSFEMPYRDYLSNSSSSPSGVQWTEPWDDMTSAYGSQYPVLTGTCGITWEQPAYNEENASKVIPSALFTQGLYVQKNKMALLNTQAKFFSRGVNNTNSNAEVASWYVDQYDRAGKQADLMRPIYDGEGQNGNYYPECYIIPMDKVNQNNIQAAADELRYLTRNSVKVNVAKKSFVYNEKVYPEGTLVVSCYQARRSLVNSQLSDGSFISVWKGLFSESYASRSNARGYDKVICAEPAAYKKIMASCNDTIEYDEAIQLISKMKAQFDGIEGEDVIIENDSTEAMEAVNYLLGQGKEVAMITKGDNKGDFITSYENYSKFIENDYIVSATGVKSNTRIATVLKQPTVYIVGQREPLKAGYVNTLEVDWDAWNLSYDRFAMNLMGFKMTTDATKADVIMGASAFSDKDKEAIKAIKKGTPYIGYGYEAIPSATENNIISGVKYASCDYGTDALVEVKYPKKTLTNATYINEGDTKTYEYGTGYFKAIPSGAKAIMKNAGKTPYQGCIGLFDKNLKKQFKEYNNAVVAFEHKNIALFANTLTHKAHIRDEYGFISNFICSKALTGKAYNIVSAEAAKTESAKIVNGVKATKLNTIKATTAKNKVTLTWKKGSIYKMDGYRVYRAASKNGTYKLVYTTKVNKAAATVTTKSLKKGKTYFYKIKGYRTVDGTKVYTKVSSKVASKVA